MTAAAQRKLYLRVMTIKKAIINSPLEEVYTALSAKLIYLFVSPRAEMSFRQKVEPAGSSIFARDVIIRQNQI